MMDQRSTPSKMIRVPKLKFNNGQEFPIFGLGTWQSAPGDVKQAVKDAIDLGYRHFDCAHLYGNEDEVGLAVKEKIDDGTVKREDVYITSKLWNTMHRPHMVEAALKTTLNDLGMDYVDLYLMHWPFALKEGGELFPVDENGAPQFSDVDYLDTWKAMEELQRKGLTKNIGVSNFNKKQIERILQNCSIAPVTNQVEAHPYLTQKKLGEYCKSKNIVITAYSPLGSPQRPWAKPGEPSLLEDPKIKQIADKYQRSIAQILVKYPVQRGFITIPKSSNKERLAQNIDIWDFELSSEDMELLDSFDCAGRICPYPDAVKHKDHPFAHDEY